MPELTKRLLKDRMTAVGKMKTDESEVQLLNQARSSEAFPDWLNSASIKHSILDTLHKSYHLNRGVVRGLERRYALRYGIKRRQDFLGSVCNWGRIDIS